MINFVLNYIWLISDKIVFGSHNIFDIRVFNEECIQELALLHLTNKIRGPHVVEAVLNSESSLVVFILRSVAVVPCPVHQV